MAMTGHALLKSLVPLLCLAAACVLPATAAPASVDVALVLAVDISTSMDEDEFVLQRAGYVEALRHPEFIRAVRTGARGRIAIAYVEWAGTVRDDGVVGWQVIDGPESADAFAASLARRPFRHFRGTSISGAIAVSANLLATLGMSAERRVIDISGDGPNNIGLPVTSARDAAAAEGIVINGLPLLIRPSPTFRDLAGYYEQCVITGPGAFMLPVRSAGEFASAIRRKLILEVSGGVPPARVEKASAAAIDCERGERDRRFYADPYFPELDP
jgi:hypothetical protein